MHAFFVVKTKFLWDNYKVRIVGFHIYFKGLFTVTHKFLKDSMDYEKRIYFY